MSTKTAVICLLALLALILFALFFLVPVLPAGASGGCLPQTFYVATDNAAQHLRYHWSGTDEALRAIPHPRGLPAWAWRRVRLARIYHRRGFDGLAARHLFYISRHVCW